MNSEVPIQIMDQQGKLYPGIASIMIVTPQAAFWRGAKKSAKIVGILLGAALPFAFLEPFLFLVWGSVLAMFLVLFLGPFLHFHFAAETKSFSSVRGTCPYCQSVEPLKPYLSTRFDPEFTVLCSSCGQTMRVVTE